MSDFFNERRPVARIEHKCCECRIVIRKGEQYQYLSGNQDGDFYNAKTCLECADIRNEANKEARYEEDLIALGFLDAYLDDEELRARFWRQRDKAKETYI